MEETKKKRGRPFGELGPKRSHTVRVSLDAKAFLESVNSSILIDRLIKECKEYAAWQQQKNQA